MNTIHSKILNNNQPVIFFELLPPTQGDGNNDNDSFLKNYAHTAVELLTSTSIAIDAINIPEIHDEPNGHLRPSPYLPKIEPRELAQQIQLVSNFQFDIILNRGTVYYPAKEQEKWLEETIHDYKINTLILVGGGKSSISYPGPSVTEMAKYISEHYGKNYLSGGIAIQHRRKAIEEEDEPYRMIAKSEPGIQFFTTQIIYDATSMKELISDYYTLCRTLEKEPKRLFLSFAPISNEKDVDFLRWLGVQIPDSVVKNLLKSNIGIGWRSLKNATAELCDILDFVQKHNIKVPLGLNIEHITPRNFDLSQMFVDELGRNYYSCFSN